MRKIVLFFNSMLVMSVLFAQEPTAANERFSDSGSHKSVANNSMVGKLSFTNIGPTIMSGRVTDLAVNPEDPTHFFVAYASGGLWETKNNGQTFTPLFQDEGVMTIGDIDVHWATGTIYLGSGEVNSSRSSYAGNGIYKSEDWGRNWRHYGLAETHHIGRVIVDQTDPNKAWVAALGHLYSDNPERGIFMTNDGGETWQHTLFVNEQTGVVDLIRHPQRKNELLAASWERDRKAWNFKEAGAGSGVYKSIDGGKTWEPFILPNTGFPLGEGTGRIGLAIGITAQGKACYFVSVDNYNRRAKGEDDPEVLTKHELKEMSIEEVLSQKDYVLEHFLRSNGYPKKLDVNSLRSRLETGDLSIENLIDYLSSANSNLFDTPIVGLEIYRSDDEGKRWKRTHDDYIEGVYNSYGYYFGQLAVNPQNCNQLYAMGVPIIRSDDGGATWKGVNGRSNVHADHHALWINPNNPKHLINGNDGGVNISYDSGAHWFKANTPAVGQFYTVAVDNHPGGYRVYGGLQDNGVWRGPHNYKFSDAWVQEGQYSYKRIMGGDGMQVAVDPRDNETVYTGYQFGNYYRLNPENGSITYITPKHELGEHPFRWNWQAPIHLSTHQADVVYFGSNFLHRSLNQGDDWERISKDLTKGGRAGDVPYGTLSSIHESSMKFGLLYTGSDDGLVHVSKDGGYSWTDITQGLPSNLWVSRVQASSHKEGRVYVALNAYRYDNFNAHVFVSDNYGDDWRSISAGLPAEPVNVVKEDPVNENILYVGTDHGLYISLDGGASYELAADMPRVAVHDLVVQPKAKDLIVATHGRSLYKADLELLQQSTKTMGLVLLAPNAVRYSSRWGADSWWTSSTAPKLTVSMTSPIGGKGGVTIRLKDGPELYNYTTDVNKGVSSIDYDLSFSSDRVTTLEDALNRDKQPNDRPIRIKAADNGKYYLRPATYVMTLRIAGKEQSVEFVIK